MHWMGHKKPPAASDTGDTKRKRQGSLTSPKSQIWAPDESAWRNLASNEWQHSLPTPGEKDSRKKGQLFTCCREKSFPARNSRLLFQPGCVSSQGVGKGGGERRREGNVASGCECICEGVHSSLHKPPASSAEERRLVLTDMLQSQQSLQENSSSSAGLICSPCPWCSLGDCQGSQPSSQSSFDWVGWE